MKANPKGNPNPTKLAGPGPGRPKGSRPKLLAGLEAAAESGMMPLEFLLVTMRNPAVLYSLRLKAAVEAAPYCHSKLATLTIDDKRPAANISELDARLIELIAELMRRKGLAPQIPDHRNVGPAGVAEQVIEAEIIDHDKGPSE